MPPLMGRAVVRDMHEDNAPRRSVTVGVPK
jgi:hypothetical protein